MMQLGCGSAALGVGSQLSEGTPEGVPPAYRQLANRFARVHRHLRKWARRTATTCYRIYDHDIADQPLIVDWYDGDVVCWAHDRTRNETPDQEEAWLAAVREAIRVGLAVTDQHLFLKRRRRQRDRQHGGQYEALDRRGVVKVVGEGELRFEINLSDYLDTGLFLDHRPLRKRVQGEAAGRNVLNLFSYTGAFTCHAAAGRASTTVSVDLSNTYLEWAARNLALNGIEIGERHRLVRADAMPWLLDEAASGRRYGIIVCDPPTFSNSAAMAHDFAVERDVVALIEHSARLLEPGGTLYFGTNARGFRLDESRLAGLAIEDISDATIPEDFRDRKIHRCWRMHA